MNKTVKLIQEKIGVSHVDAVKIVEKAIAGGEINDAMTLEEWFDKRFSPNCVLVDETGYTKMCVDALKIIGTTAATDYGASRQRDLGQLWADMTRGYLGEYAFMLFLKEKWGIEADLGHEKGEIQQYLPMDIHKIRRKCSDDFHEPKINIGVKTTKWNGIWLDIPGNQFNHSDIHVLMKIGAGRDHLIAFFKKISVFKDKVLAKGKEVGNLSNDEADTIFDNLPTFSCIPAYVCGFVRKSDNYKQLSYKGKKGRLHYNICAWNGSINPGDLDVIKQTEGVSAKGKVNFSGIGKFAHDKGYLFNSGNLLWQKNDWKEICDSL